MIANPIFFLFFAKQNLLIETCYKTIPFQKYFPLSNQPIYVQLQKWPTGLGWGQVGWLCCESAFSGDSKDSLPVLLVEGVSEERDWPAFLVVCLFAALCKESGLHLLGREAAGGRVMASLGKGQMGSFYTKPTVPCAACCRQGVVWGPAVWGGACDCCA